MGRRILAAAAAALISLSVAGPVAADETGYTRGDAEAHFHSYPPGGNRTLEFHAGLDIRPFQEFFGDVPYCVDDWHLLALNVWDYEHVVPDLGTEWTRADVVAFLRGLAWDFVLDGNTVDTSATEVKPYLAEDQFRDELELAWEEFYGADVILGQAWALQHGRVLSPDDLSVGEHSLVVVVTAFPGEPHEFVLAGGEVTFTAYASDSPACVG